MFKVVVVTDLDRLSRATRKFACEFLEGLSFGGNVEIVRIPRSTMKIDSEVFKGCDAVITRPTDHLRISRELLHGAGNQVLLLTASVGTGHLTDFVQDSKRFKIENSKPFTNARGVAAFNLMLAGALLSELPVNLNNVNSRKFEGTPNQTNLRDKTWLILGSGDQASWLLALGHTSGVREFILWNDQMKEEKFQRCLARLKSLNPGTWREGENPLHVTLERNAFDGGQLERITFRATNSLDEACGRADIVSIHMPHQSEAHGDHQPTTKFVNGKMLAAFKRSPVLVNTSRGELLDEEAVLAALESGQLSGVGIDVLNEEIERLSDHSKSPLWSDRTKESKDKPNLIITPHISGSVDSDILPMWKSILGKLQEAISKSSMAHRAPASAEAK